MAAGTADIVFSGGRLVIPASSPYDRQLLVAHVRDHVSRSGQLRVLVDCTAWSIGRPAPQEGVPCRGCRQRIDRIACHRAGKGAAVYCVTCALLRPRLSVEMLLQLPRTALLCDAQAHYAYGGEWVAWTRWPQATPSEIIEDMRLQRRFAPVLRWTCAEIRLAPRIAERGGRRPAAGPLPRRTAQAG